MSDESHPPHSAGTPERTLIKDALLGAAFVCACVLSKIILGLGPSRDRLAVLAFAFAEGAVGGGVLHVTRPYMTKGNAAYYGAWTLIGAVMGMFAISFILLSGGARAAFPWGFLFVVATSIIGGPLVGLWFRQVERRSNRRG